MTEDNNHTPYGDAEGWKKTGVTRPRINPGYSILNCLWTPKFLVQEQFMKVQPLAHHTRAYKVLTKWVSTHPRYHVEDTPDTV